MKRSKSMVLTTLMASGGLSLAACDGGSTPANSPWLNPPAAESQAVGGRSYSNLQACLVADEVPDAECNTAFSEAQAQAPKFNDRQTCEERYGADQCVPRSQAGGGSFFTPLLTGFIVGQALSNLGNRGYYGRQFPGADGGFGRGYGGGFGGADRNRDYVSGRSYDAPARVQNRSSVISRGGFGGGGGRGFGG